MIEWQKANSVATAQWEKMSEEEKAGKFPIGVLHEVSKPEYVEAYDANVGLS
jgi:2-oxoglutarate ferredoxin oxidoreductase subunit beta